MTEISEECTIFMGREGQYQDYNFCQVNLYVKSSSNQNYKGVCVCVCVCVRAHTCNPTN